MLVGAVVLAALAPAAAGSGAAAVGSHRGRGRLEVASLYWQFVDLVWIVLFTTLYLLPGGIRG